jgi:NTE family protein
MAFFRKNFASARTMLALSLLSGERPVHDASDLDDYLFDRETRMDQAWNFVADWPETKTGVQLGSGARRSKRSWSGLLRGFSRPLSRILSKTTALASPHSRRKLGLAFGGGFARTIAHIGVLKVLEQEKIPIDLIAGTSAGAILGAAYCAGMSANEMEQLAGTTRFRDFARMTLSRYGLYATDRMANFCERVLRIKNFEDLKIPLAVTATDVRTGDPVVFTKGPLADPMRASCAYPGMFPPVDVDGRSLIDGMLAYSVPTTPLREMGAGFVIGVYLSADRSQQPAPRHIFEVIAQCLSIAEAKMSHLWKKDADLVIEPDIKGFSFDCFDRAKDLIASGEKAARAALPQLRRLLRLPEPRVPSKLTARSTS